MIIQSVLIFSNKIYSQQIHEYIFSRPEERGEDFSFKENQELVKYLNVSNDKIEQRKAAYELGNRYIQDNYQPTDVDKQIIKKAIDSYFDMAKSSDSNVREEGRFQIHRLWHLAVPTLLDYLKDDDLTKMELAAKSLILMRNEAIILSIIKITEQTRQPKKKQLLQFVLRKMEEQRTTIVPNRHCLDEVNSKKLYNKIVSPALQRME